MHPGLKLLHALEEGLVDQIISDVQRIEKECGGTPQANPAERVLEEDCLKEYETLPAGCPPGASRSSTTCKSRIGRSNLLALDLGERNDA